MRSDEFVARPDRVLFSSPSQEGCSRGSENRGIGGLHTENESDRVFGQHLGMKTLRRKQREESDGNMTLTGNLVHPVREMVTCN